MIINAINSTASLLLLILFGFLLGGSRAMRENNGTKVLSYFLANWALPCFIFYNIYSSFDGRDTLIDIFSKLPIPFLIIIIFILVGMAAARIFRIDPSRRGAFAGANSFGNTSFIGFPIITSLFGASALTYGMMYYIANTLLFFTVGTWLLGRDGGQKAKIFTIEGLKKIFSPMVIALILAIFLKILEFPIPVFVQKSLSYFSSVCPCIGMIFVGMVIRQNKIKREYFFPDISLLLVLRFILSPLLIGGLLMILPLDGTVKAIFFILSLMPSITQLSIMSQYYGSDTTFCALWLTVSSIVGVAYVPLLVVMIQNLFHFIG